MEHLNLPELPPYPPICGTPQEILQFLLESNRRYAGGAPSPGDATPARRVFTAQNGQKPYAVIVTCSDSRIPPEHIFGGGVGDLFVVRTAGNVVGDLELGSVEYAAAHLGAPVVMVLAHSGCGAVAAALTGHADWHIQSVVDEICRAIGDETDPGRAEQLNAAQSARNICESEIIEKLMASGSLLVVQARYDLETGLVTVDAVHSSRAPEPLTV